MATGCYTPQYFTASFKGVTFDAMDVSSEHGRRGAEGEFPFGESTGYADLGRRIRTYSIRGRFVENNHVAASGLLIAACETPGPGLLVHPTRGPVQAACRSIKVTDNPLEEQGVTYVDLDFVEGSNWLNGFNLGAFLQLGLSIAGLLAAKQTTTARDYTPGTASIVQVAPIYLTTGNQFGTLATELRRAVTSSATVSVNDWKAILELQQAQEDVSILSDAQKVFDTVRLGLAAVYSKSDGDARYQAMRRIANAAAQIATLRSTGGTSQEAIYSLVRTIAAGYMAKASAEKSAESSTVASALLEFQQVSAILEQEIEAARCDNPLFLALREFYTQAQSVLLNRIYNLPPLRIYDFSTTVHSLVAAYEIFNDAKRFQELERQNGAAFPWLLGPEVVAEAQ